jgi:hypothetical protein
LLILPVLGQQQRYRVGTMRSHEAEKLLPDGAPTLGVSRQFRPHARHPQAGRLEQAGEDATAPLVADQPIEVGHDLGGAELGGFAGLHAGSGRVPGMFSPVFSLAN